MTFDPAAAAEAGQKSGVVRRRRRNPTEAARKALLGGAKEAAAAVAALAAGRDGFEEARPELRFQAAKVVLEYVLGKPRGLEEPEEEQPVPGDHDNTFASLLAPPEGGYDNDPAPG